MRVISPKRLRTFWTVHPDAQAPLVRWRKVVDQAKWESFDDVKAVFGKRADQYKQLVIFDIGGNKYRLIAAVHYNTGRVYIRHVLTHAEYDRGKWKKN
ncbi:MAG: type II toxin-antitoxin system HigB family toxin [Gemmataceae bacterium]